MKKYLSLIAIAIASVMVLSSCHTEKIEYLDPNAPTGGSDDTKQELDIDVDVEISGSLTKAVSLTIKYTDFNGKSDEIVLNKDFEGKSPTSFKMPFHAEGKGKEFAICIIPTKKGINEYKDEKAPWNGKCNIIVKHNGKEDTRTSMRVSEASISDSMPLYELYNDAPNYFCSAITEVFKGNMLYIRINDKNEVEWVRK